MSWILVANDSKIVATFPNDELQTACDTADDMVNNPLVPYSEVSVYDEKGNYEYCGG